MKRNSFKVKFNSTVLAGDTICANARPQWLFLHGAGSGDRKRFEQLRILLANKGITSCSFDFIGHGETGGSLTGFSLESRVSQASAVIDSQKIRQPLSIVASSMGSYVAIKLTESYEVNNLILLAPAVYATKACSVPFGPAFTEIIRNPLSWLETDAWEILENYNSNLLIYEAEKDQIIPHEVIEKIYDSARNARSRKKIVVRGATHSLAKWLDERPDSLQKIVEKIYELSNFSPCTKDEVALG